MLTCTVILNPNVDNNERVTTSWNGIDGERHRVTTTSVMGNIYTRSLIISPLDLQDVGWYMCTGTITGDMNWRSLAVTTTISAQYVNNQLVMELYISI